MNKIWFCFRGSKKNRNVRSSSGRNWGRKFVSECHEKFPKIFILAKRHIPEVKAKKVSSKANLNTLYYERNI